MTLYNGLSRIIMDKMLKPETVADICGNTVEGLARWRHNARKNGHNDGPPFVTIGGANGPCRYPQSLFEEWQKSLKVTY